MSKFKIEEVQHDYFDDEHKLCIVINTLFGKLKQLNFYYDSLVIRSLKSSDGIGMWKIKCEHKFKTNIIEQYQECEKCGIGHAL